LRTGWTKRPSQRGAASGRGIEPGFSAPALLDRLLARCHGSARILVRLVPVGGELSRSTRRARLTSTRSVRLDGTGRCDAWRSDLERLPFRASGRDQPDFWTILSGFLCAVGEHRDYQTQRPLGTGHGPSIRQSRHRQPNHFRQYRPQVGCGNRRALARKRTLFLGKRPLPLALAVTGLGACHGLCGSVFHNCFHGRGSRTGSSPHRDSDPPASRFLRIGLSRTVSSQEQLNVSQCVGWAERSEAHRFCRR
jgi:hypothetical protein